MQLINIKKPLLYFLFIYYSVSIKYDFIKGDDTIIILTFESREHEEKFYYLYGKYNRLLYKYALDILKNQHDVEDVLQISWVKISNNLNKIANLNERKTVNFMITITKNTAINLYRKKKDENIVYNPNESDFVSESFEDIYMSTEISEFKKAILLLEDNYRIPLLLKFTHGYSMKEIAEILEISETNVGIRIFRAKNLIKENMSNIEV